MNFQLTLIRHGKTVANENRLYCGSTDLSLSRKGKKEIIRKVKAEIYTTADMYYTSGMLRTDETLRLIYGKDVEFTVVPGLREIDVGIFEMKSYEELKANRDYLCWINDKSGDFKCPNGESRNAFYNRVALGFLSLCDNINRGGYKNSVCITHGGVIVAITQRLFGSNKNFYDWQPEPGEGYTLFCGENGFYDYVKVYEKV
jgi:alpha-ribazole phosphatase